MDDLKKIQAKEIANFDLFLAGYLNSHSYRIPSLLKLKSNKLIAVVDQRIESQLDAPYSTINQVIRVSENNGKTWSEGKIIIHLEKFTDNKASAIDGVIVESIDGKELYLAVDIFPGGSGLMPLAKIMNPLSDHNLGYTPDGKYLKFYKTDSDEKFIKKQIKSDNKNADWYEVFKLKNNNWNDTSDQNLEKTKIYVDKSFDPKTSTLKGSVYENVENFDQINKLKIKPICSIWDGFDNQNKDYLKPKYYIDSTAYLHLFVSYDQGSSWNLVTSLNNKVNKFNKKTNCLVLGPGQGLVLKNQVDPKNNGRILFPFYEVNYALPFSVFMGISDDQGQNWKTSSYLNEPSNKDWFWLSETQMIETKNGKIIAFARNPYQNNFCVMQSDDSGKNWTNLKGENNKPSCFKYEPLNAEIMHGVTNFTYKNNEYILLSLPTTKDRKNGKIFIIKNNDFKNITPIFDVGQPGESFGYSTMQVLEKTNDYVDIGLLYEVSKVRQEGLKWVGFESNSTEKTSLASEILYKTIRLNFN